VRRRSFSHERQVLIEQEPGADERIAVATKFSTLVFLPPVVGAVVLVHYWGQGASWLTAWRRVDAW
jgi:hypothetical protein